MKKFYGTDYVAFFLALVSLVFVFNLIPHHVSVLIRGGVGFLIACIVFAAYLVIRKPDSLLELEELLRQCAVLASQIWVIAKKQTNSSLAAKIAEISQKIAHLATKCFTRDPASIDIHIKRLWRVARDFRIVLDVLNGDIRLRDSSAEISEIRNVKIPDTLRNLDEIEIAIDAVKAKEYAAAESDLQTLTDLTNLSAKATEAVDMLKQIIREKPEGER